MAVMVITKLAIRTTNNILFLKLRFPAPWHHRGGCLEEASTLCQARNPRQEERRDFWDDEEVKTSRSWGRKREKMKVPEPKCVRQGSPQRVKLGLVREQSANFIVFKFLVNL